MAADRIPAASQPMTDAAAPGPAFDDLEQHRFTATP